MSYKRMLVGGLLVFVCAKAALADGRPDTPPAQETRGALAAARTVVYFPFKGVVCIVGALASLPVYLLSGLDPQVKADTEAARQEYCSAQYLFSPEWTK